MLFDPKLAITFMAVADAGSFTRAAEHLGVAQPWVSEQIRRLEMQLGFRLLERNSRHMALTQRGARFLEQLRPLCRANEDAQLLARQLRREATEALRIGASELVADFPEKSALIDAFVQAHPAVTLEIFTAPVPELIARLKAGALDVVLAFSSSAEQRDGLEVIPVSPRIAHLIVPQEDRLAEARRVSLTDLAGRTIVSAPGRSDPTALRHAFAPFTAAGALVQRAPEANRTTVEHYAHIRRLICLRWYATTQPRRLVGDIVILPIGSQPPILEFAILRAQSGSFGLADKFCSLGRAIAERVVSTLR